jgi:hypothetical protein
VKSSFILWQAARATAISHNLAFAKASRHLKVAVTQRLWIPASPAVKLEQY